ncbi:MAG: DNA repair protein RadC [Anaerofustis sp.]
MEPIDTRMLIAIREKGMKEGIDKLHDEELLALILRNGDEVKDAVTMAANLIRRYRSLNGIIDIPVAQLMRENRGVTETAAIDIKASVEFGRRAFRAPQRQICVSSPEVLVRLLQQEMASLRQECFKSALLTAKNTLIAVEDISVGIINASLVHAREVFRAAIAQNACSLILVHNHPSGDPTPSEKDIAVTETLIQAGKIIGIKVLDHIIIGAERFCTMRDDEILSFE